MYERIGKYTTDVIQGGPTFEMPFDTAPRFRKPEDRVVKRLLIQPQ